MMLTGLLPAGVLHAGELEEMNDFAERYTAAWCSQDPARVTAFFAENGSLTINGGEPARGREAITEVVRGFMTGFPDHVLLFDKLEESDGRVLFYWTFEGTHTGPGGTGNRVRFSGHESWLIGKDGLVHDSQGTFDEADYQRQLQAARQQSKKRSANRARWSGVGCTSFDLLCEYSEALVAGLGVFED